MNRSVQAPHVAETRGRYEMDAERRDRKRIKGFFPFLDGGRVLVIDDEEMIRDACAQALRKEGCVVETAEDGETGLEALESFSPDLVLVDLKMPGMSGLDVLEEIEKTDPTVVKIVLTGFATIASAVDAMKKGTYDFITKPSTPDEIRAVVDRGLEKRHLILESEALKIAQERIRRNMISLVSHELRAPLAATVQYLEIILGGMAGQVSKEATEMIDRSNQRLREMLDLIGRWLNLATFDPLRMAEYFEALHLADLMEESVAILDPVAKKRNIQIIMESPEDLPSIQGSQVALKEVFNNLISNAIKYNRDGGWVKVTLLEDGEEIRIEVCDNGIGISEEHVSRIFDEFYRVDGRRNAPVKGSGLGLSIVRTLVNAHGGSIALESKVGEGSTFTVRIPKRPKESMGTSHVSVQ